MSSPLPFSRRTTAAVTTFLCLSVARDAWHLTTSAIQVSQLHVIHGQLFSLYRRVSHQDVENQAEKLNAIVALIQTQIIALNTVLQAIEATMQNAEYLPTLQLIAENAVGQIAKVVAA